MVDSSYLNAKSYNLLQYLLKREGYIKITEITEQMNVTRRSIYYDLEKINEWLFSEDIEPFNPEGKKGIFVSFEQKSRIQALLNENNVYQFTPEERVKIIICTVFLRSQLVYIDGLAEVCQVSRNTVFTDLKSVAEILARYHLTLEYKNKEGYSVKGEGAAKWRLFFLYFNSISNLYKTGAVAVQSRDQIKEIYSRLKEIESELNQSYVENELYTMSAFFASVHSNADISIKPEFSFFEKREISMRAEYTAVQKHFPELNVNEQLYLSLHLLGSRLQELNTGDEKQEELIYKIAEKITDSFSHIACIEFKNREQLVKALYAHLKTAVFRIHYGVILANLMLEDIKREYSELFELTKKACRELEKEMNAPIPDDEIGYLALHLGSFMNEKAKDQKKARILVICPNGVAIANMLEQEISRLVPKDTEIKTISFNQYLLEKNFDIAVSTVRIDDPDIIRVNPIFSDNDRASVLKAYMKFENRTALKGRKILEIARKYMDEKSFSDFSKEINKYLDQVNESIPEENSSSLYGLNDFLNEECVYLCSDEMKYEDAIRYAAKPLLENGKIEDIYISNIINRINHMGPYMLIAKDIMLAHAGIDEGARKTCLSMCLFQQPVEITKDRNAKLIIVLGAEDQVKHVKILNDLMKIFEDFDQYNDLLHSQTVKELISGIQEILYSSKANNN